MSNEELLNSATIKIYNGDFSGLVRSYTNATKPEVIYLPAGDYRVDVEAGEAAKTSPATASWEQKSYQGSTNFTVKAGDTAASVEVVATLSDAITKVSFDESISEKFSSNYSFTIGLSKSNSAEQLVYTSATSGKEGYFIATGYEPSLYWSFSGTLQKDGSTFTRSGEIEGVEPGKLYTMNVKYTDRDGILTFTVLVDTSTESCDDKIVFEPVSTGLSKSDKYEIWAGHATVHADVDESAYKQDSISFEYRVSGSEGAWNRVAAQRDSEGSYSQVLKGLTPATTYEYRLLAVASDGEEAEVVGDPLTLTTEEAPSLPNSSFEEYVKSSSVESDKYYSFFNPSSSIVANQTKWWDTGNAGSTLVSSSYTICDPDTSEVKDGNNSVRLHSEYVIIKFAAGNLFSGEFAGTVGTEGGKVNFGRPFTGRPTALRLWMKYSTSTVNRVSSYPDDDPVTTSDYDRAQVKVVLGTWNYRTYGGTPDCPVQVNTTNKSTFVDFKNDVSTVAYGDIILQGDGANSTNEWRQVTIPLDYTTEYKYPTHIIVSCAASMLGDYFTGSDSSELWIDGMELLYE
jgi:hypothetical protein